MPATISMKAWDFDPYVLTTDTIPPGWVPDEPADGHHAVAPGPDGSPLDLGDYLIDVIIEDDGDGNITAGTDRIMIEGEPYEIVAIYARDSGILNGLEFPLVALSLTAPDGTPRAITLPIVGDKYKPAFEGEMTRIDSNTIADTEDSIPFKNIVCFCRGTEIETERGPVRIEDLAVGDRVVTRDSGLQPIRWIGSTRLSAYHLARQPELRPISIRAGALGKGVPARDLRVSPQHRILIRSAIARRMFGASEVLVAAKQLLQVEGVDIVADGAEVEYFHMLFARHEVVISNGAETESLYTGPQALMSVEDPAREEILALFPGLRDPDHVPAAARMLVPGRLGRKLALRHRENNKPLVAN